MGNIGRPSSGCLRCRKRRVKCDEQRPGCNRCAKLSEPCPGYTNDLWIFRDETDRARKRASHLSQSCKSGKSRERPSRNESVVKVASSKANNKTAMDRSTEFISYIGPVNLADDSDESDTETKVQPDLQYNLEFQSICLFMNSFKTNQDGQEQGASFLDFIPALYISTAESSPLRRAVAAVAQVVFVNRYNAITMTPSAAQAYSQALLMTNKALQDPVTALSDETLATVGMLSIYELVVREGYNSIEGTAWANHVSGAAELLRMRGRQQLHTETGRALFRLVHSHIMCKCSMARLDPPAIFTDLIDSLLLDDLGSMGANLSQKFFYEATRLKSRIQHMVYRCSVGLAEPGEERIISSWIEEAEELLHADTLEAWSCTDPRWQPLRTKMSLAKPTQRLYFATGWVLVHLLQYWTAKLCLYRAVIEGCLILLNTPTWNEERLPSTFAVTTSSNILDRIVDSSRWIRSLADMILGCVDFALGEIDSNGMYRTMHQEGGTYAGSIVGAIQMFWPLGAIVYSPHSTTDQKLQARASLMRIGNEAGIAQALLYV